MDIRRSGESGLSLIDKLVRLDRLVANDPSTLVAILLHRTSFERAANYLKRHASVRLAPTPSGDALIEMTCPSGRGRRESFQASLHKVLHDHMASTLALHGGKWKAAARALEIDEATLRRRLADSTARG